MNTLGTRNKNQHSQMTGDYNSNLSKNDKKEIPLENAIFISAIAHPVVAGFLWLLIKGILLLLLFLGITLPTFQKPEAKIKDIEYILTERPEQKPINPKTKFRAQKNTRAGGKHNPKKNITEPERVSVRSHASQASTPSKHVQPRVAKPIVAHQKSKHSPNKAARHKAPSQNAPDIPVPPRPMATRTTPRTTARHTPFSVPVPKVRSTGPMRSRGGPVTVGPTGSDSPDYGPSPMQAYNGSPGRTGGRSSRYGVGGGNPGNPGPGNSRGDAGIDAIKEPDFGPFMADVKRRIKRYWNPPKSGDSRTVVLIFTVAKDGSLLANRIQRSSGNPESDRAAKAAVEISAPFRSLPPEWKQRSVDIEFTFDYNSISVSGARIH